MALIKCPECKKRISDTAIYCPRCGYVLANGSPSAQQNATKQRKESKSVREVLRYVFCFEWLHSIEDWSDNILDRIEGIPIIGIFLYRLLDIVKIILLLVLSLLFVLVLCSVAYAALIGLFKIHPFLAIVAFIAGLNTLAYFICYKWTPGGGALFWLTLSSSIVACIALIYLLI